jgi:hypothetical protein
MLCKSSQSPGSCVEKVTSIAWHETKVGKLGSGKYNNLYGIKIKGKFKRYKTRKQSIQDWIKRYKKYWYKNSCREMVTRSYYTQTQKPEWVNTCRYIAKQMNEYVLTFNEN